MTMPYDLWMAFASGALAVVACYAVPAIAPRVRAGQPLSLLFIAIGVLGGALWVVQFTTLLSWQASATLDLDVALAMLSLESCLVAAGFLTWLARDGHLRGMRLPVAVAVVATAFPLARYFQIAALHAVPLPALDDMALLSSTLATAVVAYIALQYGWAWLTSDSPMHRACAAMGIGCAVWAVHSLNIAHDATLSDPFHHPVYSLHPGTLGYALTFGAVAVVAAVGAVARLQSRAQAAGLPSDTSIVS